MFYLEEFKQEVIKSVLSCRFCKEDAKRFYKIGGNSSILQWMRLYELFGVCHIPLEKYNRANLPQMSKTELESLESSDCKDLSKEDIIKQLKEAKRLVADAELKNKLLEEIINIAEENYKLDIRKKYNTKQSRK